MKVFKFEIISLEQVLEMMPYSVYQHVSDAYRGDNVESFYIKCSLEDGYNSIVVIGKHPTEGIENGRVYHLSELLLPVFYMNDGRNITYYDPNNERSAIMDLSYRIVRRHQYSYLVASIVSPIYNGSTAGSLQKVDHSVLEDSKYLMFVTDSDGVFVDNLMSMEHELSIDRVRLNVAEREAAREVTGAILDDDTPEDDN